jgi:hypothetical protein
MSIVPVASLSTSDLFMLGNNLRRRGRHRRARRRVLEAVNRSLAAHGAAVSALSRHVLGLPTAALSRQRGGG